ncbi:ArnT family glycosyltransferase [Aporhodopirellula aestuarii]|uniref:Glycosyltransferase RgtA/B/C/D-like domain-containing protein n=1 Tax=Aporhodopirellula aestuarii TaxID=2950107 RepID=A0ABT0U983_9BACT|nr:hypothetical protein [Aporhodopirellula aestuarii]MCM2373254.1 hypothetical protein [Aporhodopirellula aestuarii]
MIENNDSADAETDADNERARERSRYRNLLYVLVPIALFTVLRLPALIHQPGMQDEQWFAVPGLTVWQEGIPRIPYVPTRRRETLFENADVCLMALPPGLFYVQAPFFAVFPAGYATARIPLFLGALVAIVLTFRTTRLLSRRVVASEEQRRSEFAIPAIVAGVAATSIAVSRPLLFTGLTTRPDLLCILCGWVAILILWKRLSLDRLKDSFLIGCVCGLGALFHPFALVFCIQVGVAGLFGAGTWKRRILHVLSMAGGTVAVLLLWLPLILAFPHEFRSQFFANVLDRAGPGLPSRLLWPLPALRHHAGLLWEFLGPAQCALLAIGLILGSFTLWRTRRDRIAIGYIALVWSSVYLTATVAGLHPTKGYWMYPFMWIIVLLVVSTWHGAAWLAGTGSSIRRRELMFSAISLFLLMALIPGSGLRTTWLYITHWHDDRYHGPSFIDGVLNELPHTGVFYADLSYVFDVYLSGRETRLCQEREQYWGDEEIDYAYLILSWEGEDAGWAEQYDGKWVRRIGSRETDQSCFVDLYQPAAPDRPNE